MPRRICAIDANRGRSSGEAEAVPRVAAADDHLAGTRLLVGIDDQIVFLAPHVAQRADPA